MKSHITHNEKTRIFPELVFKEIKKSFLIQDVNKFINFN